MKIQLTKFGERHFNQSFNGTKIFSHTAKEFEEIVSSMVEEVKMRENLVKIIDGYADFCKLIVVPNFTDAKTGTLPITESNIQYMRTGYLARTEKELPVLSEWLEIPKRINIPTAEYLLVILYSYDQLLKEHKAKDGDSEFKLDDDCDYGIVAVLAQMSDMEEPMKPITMMRNSLGKDQGGSGVSIDREKYKRSVDFWSKNATTS